MASKTDAANASMLLRATAAFRDLTDAQLVEIGSRAKVHYLLRGGVLIRQGAESNSVYVVASGRFEVWIEGQESAVNEVGAGEPIGEIGFFAGIARTATVVAARDSVVIELDRDAFDDVARQAPSIYPTLLRTLGRRLAVATAQLAGERRGMAARTIAVIAGGSQPIPQAFHARFNGLIERHKGRVLKQDDVSGRFAGAALEDPAVSNWLNAIEQEYELICYLGDETLTDWTRKAIRQADQVLIVVSGAAPEPLNPVETFAFATHPPSRRRLVRLHERRSGSVAGTAAWLAQREVRIPSSRIGRG